MPRPSIRRSPRGQNGLRKSGASPSTKLAGKEWCVGGKYSIADIHLFRLYWRFKDRFGLKPDDHPSVQALHDRMLQRPAVKKTIEAEAKISASQHKHGASNHPPRLRGGGAVKTLTPPPKTGREASKPLYPPAARSMARRYMVIAASGVL